MSTNGRGNEDRELSVRNARNHERCQREGDLGYFGFARIVDALVFALRARGLAVPGFQSLPDGRKGGAADRVLRRSANGTVVAVRIGSRSERAVLHDLIEGVLKVNSCSGSEAEDLRAALLAELTAPPSQHRPAYPAA